MTMGIATLNPSYLLQTQLSYNRPGMMFGHTGHNGRHSLNAQ